MNTTSRPLRAAMIGALLLALVGCTAAPAPQATPAADAAESTFPRTVAVPAGVSTEATTLEISKEPQRIAALTYETAELVVTLGAADRLVLIPAAAQNPALTNHLDQMSGIENVAPTESTTNAEAVIALAPDLVLMSARHGLEDGAGLALAAAGIPVLVLPNSWATIDDMTTNIALVGQAIGADAESVELASTIAAGLKATGGAGAGQRVLVLSNQAGRPFVTAGKAFPLELLRLAGAVDASVDLGMTSTGPITVEQVVAAAPDAVLLIDMNGSGERLFAPVLENPAVAAMPAMSAGRVLLVTGNQVQALGLEATVSGLAQLKEWLAQ